MEKLTEDEFLFIWEPILGHDEAWSEYCSYDLWCDIDDFNPSEEDDEEE